MPNATFLALLKMNRGSDKLYFNEWKHCDIILMFLFAGYITEVIRVIIFL